MASSDTKIIVELDLTSKKAEQSLDKSIGKFKVKGRAAGDNFGKAFTRNVEKQKIGKKVSKSFLASFNKDIKSGVGGIANTFKAGFSNIGSSLAGAAKSFGPLLAGLAAGFTLGAAKDEVVEFEKSLNL